MKVKALKLFGDGKRLYAEGEIAEMEKEEIEKLNSISNGPLVEMIPEEKASKGVGIDGDSNNTRTGKSKAGNKHNN